MNGRDHHQKVAVIGHRTVRWEKLDMGGHSLKPLWWLTGIIIAFIL
jgi:hypothetical protein